MSLEGNGRAVFSVVLGENAGVREQRGAACLCVFRGAQRPYHRQSRLVRKREGLRESQITGPALVL